MTEFTLLIRIIRENRQKAYNETSTRHANSGTSTYQNVKGIVLLFSSYQLQYTCLTLFQTNQNIWQPPLYDLHF